MQLLKISLSKPVVTFNSKTTTKKPKPTNRTKKTGFRFMQELQKGPEIYAEENKINWYLQDWSMYHFLISFKIFSIRDKKSTISLIIKSTVNGNWIEKKGIS